MDFQSQNRRTYLQFACAVALAALLPLQLAHAQSTGGTLERVRSAGKLVLGYRADAQPMSYRDTSSSSSQPSGYAVTLCKKVADSVKSQLRLPTLAVDWVEVTAATGEQMIQQGKIDLLCTADEVTLARREHVAFSVPIFLGGIGALLSNYAPMDFQHTLENRPEAYKPIWRGTAPPVFQNKTASVVAGTSAVELLAKRINELKIIATISTEQSYAAGMLKVAQGKSDVLVGDRAQLLAAVKQSPTAGKLKVLNRRYTHELLALTLARNDDDFRLAVDRGLAAFVATPQFGELYVSTFGKPDADTVEFFRGVPH
jgi:polar amino acid transport system substrate-binding protein